PFKPSFRSFFSQQVCQATSSAQSKDVKIVLRRFRSFRGRRDDRQRFLPELLPRRYSAFLLFSGSDPEGQVFTQRSAFISNLGSDPGGNTVTGTRSERATWNDCWSFLASPDGSWA